MKSFSYQDYLDNFKYSRIINFGKINNIRPIFIQQDFIQLYPTKRLLKYIWLFFLVFPTIIFFILLIISIIFQKNNSDFIPLLFERTRYFAFYLFVFILIPLLFLFFITFKLRTSTEWSISKIDDKTVIISVKNEDTKLQSQSYPNAILKGMTIEPYETKIPFLNEPLFQLSFQIPSSIENDIPPVFYLMTGKKDDLELFKEIFISWSKIKHSDINNK